MVPTLLYFKLVLISLPKICVPAKIQFNEVKVYEAAEFPGAGVPASLSMHKLSASVDAISEHSLAVKTSSPKDSLVT